jgi:hypothetical protein
MGRLRNIEELFAGRHFDREVILCCVRWYLRYKLSAENRLSLRQTLSLPDYLLRIFVIAKRNEFGMSQMVGACPLQ